MITIDVDSEEPMFKQLVQQIKQALESKLLTPGDALPSIRQLASDLELNAKTVAKAYRLLERDKILEANGPKGSKVRVDALEHLSFDIQAWLLLELRDAINKYRQAGATDSEIRQAFNLTIAEQGN
jgi:GntR family transcriptional regulator